MTLYDKQGKAVTFFDNKDLLEYLSEYVGEDIARYVVEQRSAKEKELEERFKMIKEDCLAFESSLDSKTYAFIDIVEDAKALLELVKTSKKVKMENLIRHILETAENQY